MTRYLLDTSIFSNVIKASPSEALVNWMAAQPNETIFIASLTIAEIWRAIAEKPAGKKRKRIERWFAGPEGPLALFAGRILAFDEKAALIWGRLMAENAKSNQPRNAQDMIIAAVAEAHDCIVVTTHEKNLAGLQFINPMRTKK
jgi:toxin FitB